jgi:Glycosyl hydrolase catalytic core
MAAYTGIKAGNSQATVAAGETSNRGRDRPTGSPGLDSVAPATFAQGLAQVAPKLPFVAWATHPYPSDFFFGPTQKVAFPNVSFSTMTEFGTSLQKWFKRPIPIWVTEYGEMTKPECVCGVSYAQQATDVRNALRLAATNPYVEMFVWFILRDSNAQTWYSGLEKATGMKKPAYAAFASTAAGIVGKTQLVRPGVPFSVTLAVPFMIDHDPPGKYVGVTWAIRVPKGIIGGQPRVKLQTDETITFPVSFKPVKGQTYTMTVLVNDVHGQTERHVVQLLPTP